MNRACTQCQIYIWTYIIHGPMLYTWTYVDRMWMHAYATMPKQTRKSVLPPRSGKNPRYIYSNIFLETLIQSWFIIWLWIPPQLKLHFLLAMLSNEYLDQTLVGFGSLRIWLCWWYPHWKLTIWFRRMKCSLYHSLGKGPSISKSLSQWLW